MNKVDFEYVKRIRRELHSYPEVGFDLPKTIAIIKRELDAMGISYTDKYGKSSLVGYIAEGRGGVIALRADIDALPIKEDTGLPYSSCHEGKMHACGHDAHCAMLLGTAKMLKDAENELPCEVRLFFQAAEEYAPGGAKLMCEDGVMDGVDAVIGLHIDPDYPLGTVNINYGTMSAASHGFYIHLYGKSSHVATPHMGIDAIAMAARVYTDLQIMRARELNPSEPAILGIGEFHGGDANNVVCDHVYMHGTIRSMSNKVDEYIYKRIEGIATAVATDMGGRSEVITSKHYPSIVNDKEIAEEIVSIAKDLYGEKYCNDKKRPMMGGEDFSFYLLRGRGAFFHLGAGSDKIEVHPFHNPKFVIDEEALRYGPEIYAEFVMRYGKKITK